MSLWNMNGFALAVTGCVIGLALIAWLKDNKEKENVLGNYLVEIGCILLIAAAQQENVDNQSSQDKSDSTLEQINQLKERIAQLELQLK